MASTVASTSAATLRSTASSAGRRVNRRTARSSAQHAVASLAELYHLAPTFVPATDATRLSQHVTSTLTPLAQEASRPRPSDFRDLVTLNRRLDLERVRLTASRTLTPSLQAVDLATPANYSNDGLYNFDSAIGGRDAAADRFNYRASFYQAYSRAGEPPLAQRMRKVVDALHGTTAGGRAGPDTVREHGEKAVRWNRELEQARSAARDQRTRDEEESRAFQEAFDDEAAATAAGRP
ncbi:hypothetical protein BMF94_4310 [Rhodotorula taiwanensis]|uniref:Uncharacterized protein n=1 Tax=Rhodotorula taiwanensis TaxID=741276 RepID=A0A2S5B6S2_9BASI|nr:hypothetical protein BMF94_4310 [Rhodotorula taiwanensis]